MNNRSTNTNYVHFQGDITSNVESSHGVQLTGGSTGGIVQAFGDDANISLTVRGQGTGGVTIGNSSQAVSMAGTVSFTGASFSVTASSIVIQPGSTGAVTVGTSSTPINVTGSSISLVSTHAIINSTRIIIGTSTTAISGVQRYYVEYTVPAMAAGASAVSSVTVTGLTTNSILVLQPRQVQNTTVTGVWTFARCSTANELTVEIHNNSASTISGSTVSAYLLQFAF